MPVTATLGALTYNKFSLTGSSYDYWLIVTQTNTRTFGNFAFDDEDAFYIVSSVYNSDVPRFNVDKFKEYNTYPYTIGSMRYITPAVTAQAPSDPSPKPYPPTAALGQIIQYNSVDGRMVTGGSINLPRFNFYPLTYQYAGEAFTFPKTLAVVTPPSNLGFIDYPAEASGTTRVYEDMAIDDAGNYYFVGSGSAPTGLWGFFIRRSVNINSTAQPATCQNLVFSQSSITGSTGNNTAVDLDSSQNPVMCGTMMTTGGSPTRQVLVRKLDKTPVVYIPSPTNWYTLPVTWQISLTYNSNFESRGLKIDSNDNVYVVCNETNSKLGHLLKFNSSGVLQWQRRITGVILQGLTIDSSDNIYVVGQNTSNNLFVAKYNSSGTIQWQNKLSGATLSGVKIIWKYDSIYSRDALYVMGNIGTTNGYLIKLPTDGSIPGDGSYPITGATLVYQTATQTEAAGTVIVATDTTASVGQGQTVITPSITSLATTNSQTIYPLV